MSHQIHQEEDTKKFTLTIFLSFVVVFCFLVLMAQCKGPYHPPATHATSEQAASHE
ncbi:hypothetical protein [Hydrotalea sp.]|uniref:hypothetical protein n=1 Tax=Hydrotalea sp. TaxID=2881279 RepID=UPI002625B408|nr:hypothetical protein [Hydrotalea sp.]